MLNICCNDIEDRIKSLIDNKIGDWLYLDEVDYINSESYDAVTTIAAERSDIGITMSSTPTGARSHFYEACTNPELGFRQHFHPSTDNPNWDEKLESQFKAQLTAQAYVHEILAEFGTQDKGVFPKDKLDASILIDNYAYNELTYAQKHECEEKGKWPTYYMYNINNRPKYNPFRTIGVDWDKNKIFSKQVA